MDGCVLKSGKPGTLGTLVVISISSHVGLSCNNVAVTIALDEQADIFTVSTITLAECT